MRAPPNCPGPWQPPSSPRPGVRRLNSRAKKLRAGTVLFRRGDAADRLYLLAEGRMGLVEIGHEIPAGRVFGEIALFSPAKRRTHSARCLTPCTVLHISEDTVKQLYYQNPAFGFHLIGLVAARLSDDVERAGPPSVGNPCVGAPAASAPAAGDAARQA